MANAYMHLSAPSLALDALPPSLATSVEQSALSLTLAAMPSGIAAFLDPSTPLIARPANHLKRRRSPHGVSSPPEGAHPSKRAKYAASPRAASRDDTASERGRPDDEQAPVYAEERASLRKARSLCSVASTDSFTTEYDHDDHDDEDDDECDEDDDEDDDSEVRSVGFLRARRTLTRVVRQESPTPPTPRRALAPYAIDSDPDLGRAPGAKIGASPPALAPTRPASPCLAAVPTPAHVDGVHWLPGPDDPADAALERVRLLVARERAARSADNDDGERRWRAGCLEAQRAARRAAHGAGIPTEESVRWSVRWAARYGIADGLRRKCLRWLTTARLFHRTCSSRC
jgi:hypothetical protein